jgi:hypothetical protein
LTIKIFFLKKKKNIKKKKKKEGNHWPKMEWPDLPIFGHSRSRGDRTTPMAKGVVWPPLKGQRERERERMAFGLLGVARPLPRAWGGGSATPKCQKIINKKKKVLGFWG